MTKKRCIGGCCNSEMGCENKKKKLEQALYERAIGFTQEDVSEEFGMVDNSLKLIKRKTSKKYYPPEIRAIEMMMENFSPDDDLKNKNLDELLKERERLIKMLDKAEKNDKKN